MLPVNEIFQSVQGEATFTGTPSVFVRLQGCPVGCGWCDTKHTWELNHDHVVSIHSMIDKQNDSESHAIMSALDLTYLVSEKYSAKHIVITGGEPCLYDLIELTTLLINNGCSVQIETSGTKAIYCHKDTFVTLSPKIGMPGGLKVLESNWALADEIKMPVGKQSDIEKLRANVPAQYMSKVWLQPLSQSKSATKLCVDQATENGWKVSIQTHKYLGVR